MWSNALELPQPSHSHAKQQRGGLQGGVKSGRRTGELGFPKAAGGWLSGARPSHGPVPVIILLFITPCAVLDAQ